MNSLIEKFKHFQIEKVGKATLGRDCLCLYVSFDGGR